MFKKYLTRCLYFAIVLASSAQAGYLPPEKSPFPPAENPFYLDTLNQRQLGYFTNIVISGNIDVDIKTGVECSDMVLTGDKETLKRLQVTQKNDTLTIGLSPGFFDVNPNAAKAHIDIYTHFLNNLTLKNYTGHLKAVDLDTGYFNANLDNSGSVLLSGKIGLNHLNVKGNGITQIQGINSQDVVIRMQDSPTVDLTGVANLRSLKAEGSGHLRLYWVDSDSLSIFQKGTTYVELAGIANNVYLNLEDEAHFNGRYLRAKLGHAKTYGTSLAEVQFLRSQAVLSSDKSTISYYGKPPYNIDYMAYNGAVLDMNDH